jgi:2-dehydropantoate 2-reductase
MKIAVVGTGGVGGLFGGLLANAGHDVTFIAHGSHMQAIRARGLRIEIPDWPITVAPADATDVPAEVGPVDLALLCVKTYDMIEAIEQMRPLVGPQTTVLTLQNGVEAPDMAAAALGQEKVLPGLVYCEAAIKEPGVIFVGSNLRRIVLGERDGSTSMRAGEIAGAFTVAGAETVLSQNVMGALWGKFCFICAMGGCTALTRRPLGALVADEEGQALLRVVMAEACAVAEASGVRFDGDPVDAGMSTAARFPYETKSSMQRDLERGGRLEIEALNGAVVRLGRSLQVSTPANQAIYAALRLAQPVS